MKVFGFYIRLSLPSAKLRWHWIADHTALHVRQRRRVRHHRPPVITGER